MTDMNVREFKVITTGKRLSKNLLWRHTEGFVRDISSYLPRYCVLSAHRLSLREVQVLSRYKAFAFDDIHEPVGKVPCYENKQDFSHSSL